MQDTRTQRTWRIRRVGCQYDVRFDIGDPRTQAYLLWVCRQLLARSEQVDPEQTTCLATELHAWAQRADVQQRYAALVAPARVAFPFTGQRRVFHRLLWEFAQEARRLDDVGFTDAGPDHAAPQQLSGEGDAADLRAVWVRLRFVLRRAVRPLPRRAQWRVHRYWDNVERNVRSAVPWGERAPRGVGSAFHTSQAWVDMHTEVQAEFGTSWTIGVAAATFVCAVLVFTASLRLFLCAVATAVGVVVASVSTMRLAGWHLGPVEQVGTSLLMGIAAEYTIHITEGYLEYIHAAQSSLLARGHTRAHALSGTLQRTGAPLLAAFGSTLISCAVLVFSELLVVRRVAHIMIANTLIGGFHGLVVFSALILAVGPTELARTARTSCLFLGSVVCLCVLALFVVALSGEFRGPSGELVVDP